VFVEVLSDFVSPPRSNCWTMSLRLRSLRILGTGLRVPPGFGSKQFSGRVPARPASGIARPWNYLAQVINENTQEFRKNLKA
jgi:hypothetical protein